MQQIMNASVMIVDDKQSNLDILREVLEDEGYTIHCLSSGEQALQRISKEPPDLILLDIIMPGKDGFTVCRELKSDPDLREIPVIFLTAVNDTENVVKGFELGAADYIGKPVNRQELLARVRTHLALTFQSRTLKNLADRDGLTLIANRRRFEEFLDLEIRRCFRNDWPISLIMADVDHFKLYNDNYGHLAGDKVLKGVSGVMEENLKRPGDLAARYGGEEFAAILGNTSRENALALAEKIRADVENLRIPHDFSKAHDTVTMSLGVATLYPGPDTGREELIEAADERLYAAKEAGRNRVK